MVLGDHSAGDFSGLFPEQYCQDGEQNKSNRQTNRDDENRLFQTAPRSKNLAAVRSGQTSQPNAFVLKDHAGDQCD